MQLLVGPVVKVERVPAGQSSRPDPETGEVRTWAAKDLVHVLDGSEVRHCKVGDDFGVLPVPDISTPLTFELEVTPYRTNSGAASLSYTLVRPYVADSARRSA